MTIVSVRVADLPAYVAAAAVDGALRWEPQHLQVTTSAGTTVDLNVAGFHWAITVSDQRGGSAELSLTETETLGDSGVYVETSASGYVHILIDADDVAALGAGEHWYEVKAAVPSGHAYLAPGTYCLLHGPLSIGDDAVG